MYASDLSMGKKDYDKPKSKSHFGNNFFRRMKY